MNTLAPPPPPSSAILRSRSLGAKFFIVLLLAFGMSISGFFMEGLTTERAERRGLLAASSENASEQPQTVLGIRLADSYRSTRRSLHYITLFLSLVFLTYFLFEVLTGKSVHPAQYALVGIAQTIFYLLLLSLSEHLGFDWSFLIAGASTVALFAINTEWVFLAGSWLCGRLGRSRWCIGSFMSCCVLRPMLCSLAPLPALLPLPLRCTSHATWSGMGTTLGKLAWLTQLHLLRRIKSYLSGLQPSSVYATGYLGLRPRLVCGAPLALRPSASLRMTEGWGVGGRLG